MNAAPETLPATGRQAALALAEEHGRAVFPCRPRDEQIGERVRRAKEPLTPHGFEDASAEPEQIRAWWRRWPDALVGVPTGRGNNLLVIDIDPDGADWYQEHAGRLACGRVHRTRRGHHLLYTMPEMKIRNSAGKLALGLDVRAEGGYIVWWPAHGLEATGTMADIGPAPDWLLERLREPSRIKAKAPAPQGAALSHTVGRNDYLSRQAYRLRREGLEEPAILAVLRQLNAARCSPPLEDEELRGIVERKMRNVSEPEPVPLVRPLEPSAPYPVDALGDILGAAARAIAEHVQVPESLAGNSVLAAAALAAQPHANVATLGGIRPLSLYVLTVAESGARKSTADAVALLAIRERSMELAVQHRDAAREHEASMEAHKLAERRAKENAKDDPEALQRTLLGLREPVAPRLPWFVVSEPTPEGLVLSLKDGQFSQGLFNDEAGTFIGGAALSEESELRTVAMLSRLWQGDPIDRVRAKDREHVTLFGRRLSLHLMAQPDVALRVLAKPLYRSQGFLARLLIAAPKSLAGTRLHRDRSGAAEDDPRIRSYFAALSTLLRLEALEDEDVGGLLPRTLRLEDEARRQLIAAYNELEAAQAPDGELSGIRDFAAKAAEHACRIAGVLTLVADPHAQLVGAEHIAGALRLVEFYLHEQARLAGAAAISPRIAEAQKLLDWIARKERWSFKLRDLVRLGPNAIRDSATARQALETLREGHWIVEEEDGSYRVTNAARRTLCFA